MITLWLSLSELATGDKYGQRTPFAIAIAFV
jgi:hypothetical protein